MNLKTHKWGRALGASLFIFIASACLNSCSNNEWRQASGAVWGTTYHITYKAARDLSDSIIAVTEEINQSLSMFNKTSTVSRINAGKTDSVDRHFINVYKIACEVFEASAGKFDPTVAPLVDLWGFGRDGRETALPNSASVNNILKRVGLGKTSLHGACLIKENPLTEFDFSAIAKGYGVDCVARMFHRNGCNDFMVEIGGEISLSGYSPRGKNWNIQVDAPIVGSEPGDSALTILSLTDCAVATSGNYRNFRTGNNGSIGHTIDPLTGFPAANYLLSATVLARECALADALATALMAMPADSASTLLDKFPDTWAIIVAPDGQSILINRIEGH